MTPMKEADEAEEAHLSNEMEWAVPLFKRGEVDWAGRTYAELMTRDDWNHADYERWDKSLDIMNNWRSAHAFPLNTFQVGLRRKARKFEPNPVVAQRTKRLWSIWHKLDRFPTMQLSQMQDIAGCRVILSDAANVGLVTQDYKSGSLKHAKKITDYIEKPRGSGYRGVHIIWKYYSDKNEVYNGLQIEMQIRTVFQHAWATSVETMGTVTQQALKSSLGDSNWLRFFSLMAAVMAYRERCSPVPGTPTDPEGLVAELRVHPGSFGFPA
jgi:ppGpp synthetase/RelA/SpoT-type nucleotidyltranferase